MVFDVGGRDCGAIVEVACGELQLEHSRIDRKYHLRPSRTLIHMLPIHLPMHHCQSKLGPERLPLLGRSMRLLPLPEVVAFGTTWMAGRVTVWNDGGELPARKHLGPPPLVSPKMQPLDPERVDP